MFRVLLVALLSLRRSMAAPTCTADLCCHDRRYGYCADNTHKSPVGDADPVAYTSSELAGNTGDVSCGVGYKDKENKATLSGINAAACCDQRTCSDLTCNSGTQAKTDPTQPTEGNEPTQTNCCEDITGMCSGNANAGDTVSCGTGYKDKEEKAGIAGDAVAACCDQKTCSDLVCSTRTQAKTVPTQPTEGNEPAQADCCEDITGMCSGNTNAGDDVSCGTGYKDKENKATVAGTTDAACCDANQQCAGNPAGDGDVTCPGSYINKGASDSYDRFGSDDTNAKKYAKCCTQAKCIKNVVEVVGTCETLPVSQVAGTCNLALRYAEKANIESLPADPSDWSDPGTTKDVTPGSNLADCCAPIEGMCSGNTDTNSDVSCGTGFKDKESKEKTSGSTVNACCDQKTCSDLTCSSGTQAKTTPTQPTEGNEPTQTDCCEDITGMCLGNQNTGDDVSCGTGYMDKENKEGIAGDTAAACCDRKTCSDLGCSSGTQAKAGPTQPTEGNEPTQTDCCEDITGMCSGNANAGDTVSCGTGYKDKEEKAGIAGDTVAACCDQKTCSDLTCPSGKRLKSSPTQPEAGDEPTIDGCCEEITGMCWGNAKTASDVTCGTYYTDAPDKATITGTTVAECCEPVLNTCMSDSEAGVPFDCGTDKYAVELPTVQSIASQAATDCANDDFDVPAIEGQVGYGPVCLDPLAVPDGDGDKGTVNGASRPAMGVVVMAAFASLPLAVALAI